MTAERWRDIERLFHAAVALAADRRRAFLDEACAADESLREEVESLLRRHEAAPDFLEPGGAGGRWRDPLTKALRDRADLFVPGQLAGRRLGVYELETWLASGGMGQVYRAMDTRLGRTVAVKIIPTGEGLEEQARQQFEHEARLISSLNHPSICTLYDVGSQEGFDYLVMEFLEGETLEQRLRRGALPLADALDYAIAITDALEKAHRRGIVHRDLKPGNIMLVRGGLKLLDFGIAVPQGRGGETPVPAEILGLGTPEYSSPEQLDGAAGDARGDLFSLGVVLFTMLAGRHPSRRMDGGAALPGLAVPVALEATVLRCLAKDPDERWQTAADLLFQLRGLRTALAEKEFPNPPRRVPAAPWIAGLVVAAVLIAVWVAGTRLPAPTPSAVVADLRFSLFPAPGTSFASGYDIPFAVAPNGRRLVYAGVGSDGIAQLWLRSLSSDPEPAQALNGTQGATTPFWSPDGEWIGFFSGRTLKKLRLSTGLVQPIAEGVATMGGAAWSRQNVIVFPAAPGGLFRVPANGGKLEAFTRGEGTQFWPQFLADGRHVLYAAGAPGEVQITSLAGGDARGLMRFPTRISSLAYAQGHLFYVQDGTLFARPFDEASQRFNGEARRLLEGIPVTPPGRAPFAVSEAGVLAFWTYPGGTPADLRWFDAEGRPAGEVAGPSGRYVGFSLDPKGTRLVFSRRSADGGADLWLRDLASQTEAQLTFDKAAFTPQWAPDGERIAYTGPGQNPPPKILIRNLRMPGPDRVLGTSRFATFVADWSRDGRQVLGVRLDRANGADLWLHAAEQGDPWRLPVNSAGNETEGRLSPDGRWIAYVTDASGREEVWVASLPDARMRRQVSAEGGTSPQWARDGRQLFYLAGDALLSAPVGRTPEDLAMGKPRLLFRMGNLAHAAHPLLPTANAYVVSADGRRFLMAVRARDTSLPPIRVIGNWRALVPR